MTDVPFVRLPGSETYWSGYEYGTKLYERWPEAGASDFAYAVEYNGWEPECKDITDLVMEHEGERDEDSWTWRVTLADGTVWKVEGWCDYTGWDCQSGISWEQVVV
jgi:hypothetical protein